ncbi:PQQ-dependent sugar dehydrogenase [Aurantiacibacter spongiae]|uniref:PQQ-dependent sugar dehydrogenase n=1 Tax=Aurantiacibacter spongiae TaxID=2488860 RepID=A0A3N5D046_9SPHN|nr:PQQ-dependent sugar dehydrogenase [Aurantiacibacter spongiae]RPF72359.1 PQQ-dependent sugar dehydrogenase [Aurantiacibacter spongiae]
MTLKTRRSIIALFPAALAFASCNSGAVGDSAPSATASNGTTASAPVAGTRVTLGADAPFTAVSLGEFDEPWALALEPGSGRIVVTERPGTARIFDPATGELRSITGLPQVAYAGQGGLGDFAFAPDYATSGKVYLSWAKAAQGNTKRAVVGSGELRCDDGGECRIAGLREIWEQSVPIDGEGHYSHRLAFSPDGRLLFVSSGERQQKTPAQDLSNNLGSIVRLNLDGTPADGNPFARRGAPSDQIWSYGHRNVLGLAFDPSGNLWELEHGPAGGDELNLVRKGANYGWPVRSNGDNYDGSPIPDHSPDDGFAHPAISWNPVIAPGGMIFYTGDMFPDWDGQALIANLKTTSISRVSVDAGANSAREVARYDFPERLRDILEGADGAIWVVEDGENGRLIRLTPRR